MQIRLEPDKVQADVARTIEQRLLESLRAANPQGENSSFVLSVRDGDNLAGGLTAAVSYGWLLIKTLWVDPSKRRHGLGRTLVRAAEQEGRDRGCHAAWLDTSDAGAMAFYCALGYAPFGEITNGPAQLPNGHRRWFMKRDL